MMKRWKKAALITGTIVLLPAGFVALLLPGIVRRQVVQKVEAATGRKLDIGGISINPFNWTVLVHDLRFSERAGGETFASFSSARIGVSPISLYRWAPTIAAIRLSSPHLRIERFGSGRYNFSDLLRWLPRHPHLYINNLAITNGSADFIDRGLPVERRHELRKVELTVPFLTTIPYFAERYITPHLSAVLNGSPIHLEAKFRPLPRTVEATATLELKEVFLPYYLPYLPKALPVRLESGTVSAKLALNYRARRKGDMELAVNGRVTLADMKVSDRTGAPFLSVKRFDAAIVRARPLKGDFELSTVFADGLEVFLTRDKSGIWSHSRLAGRASPGAAPWRKAIVSVEQTLLRNGRFNFIDSRPPGGFAADLEGISLDMRGYSTSPGKRARFALFFKTKRGEAGSLKGEFSPRPFASSSSIELTGVPLEAYYPYLASLLHTRVKGQLHAAAKLDFGGPAGFTLENVSIEARQLSALFGKRDGITLASLFLDEGRYSRKENLLEVNSVTLRDGALRFSRDRKGAFLPLSALQAKRKAVAAPPLRYRIALVSGEGINAHFTDEMQAKRPSFALRNITFSLRKLTGPPFRPIPFKIAGAYGEGGSLTAFGSVTPVPWKLNGEVGVQLIPLTDFNAYLPENLNLVVADGKVDARLALHLAAGRGETTGSFGGSVGIRSLYCIDAKGEDLLKWESLDLGKMKGSLAPFALAIGDLSLTRFYSRIIVEKDGSLNLQHVYNREQAAGKPEIPAKGREERISIDAVTMQDGTVAFTDHHVTGGYTTTLYNLGGRISGLSFAANRFADLDLRGNLENRSPLRITGQINPLRGDLFADLKVSFTDIELSPMTPYSGTYLGYAVNRGKLFLNSRYLIENRKLDLENKVFIDQLDLGKRIESDKATTLPVLLAIALLKDRRGEIRLDIPVTGQTDAPQFSVWHVVLESLKNFFVTAVNSPFVLLQSISGGKQDISSLGFTPGSAELSDSEREKLLKLATVLNDRPALKLEVAGFVDRERDDEGYRNEFLLKQMRAEKFLDMVRQKMNRSGDSPQTVEIAPGEYARYLKMVYAGAQFPKPRNIFGQVKALADQEMKKLILANTAVGEEQLRSLADARAAGVTAFLVKQGRVDPARVIRKSGDIYRAPGRGGEPGSRVEFKVVLD